jgi:hypothetical protein
VGNVDADVAETATATVTASPKESIAGALKRVGKLLNGVVECLPNKSFRGELEALVRKYDNGHGVG